MANKSFLSKDIVNAIWENGGPLELVSNGSWIDEGKWQWQSNVLRDTATGKFYEYILSRSGSYFTDYQYGYEYGPDEIELTEVEKAIKTVEYWKMVNV